MTLTLFFPPRRHSKRMLRDIPPVTPELLADIRRKAERALHYGHTVNITAHVALALLQHLDVPDVDPPRRQSLF